MTLNVQTNVAIPQSQMTFKAWGSPEFRKTLKKHQINLPKLSFMQRLKFNIAAEKYKNYRHNKPIGLNTYINAIKAALGINPNKVHISINKNAKL